MLLLKSKQKILAAIARNPGIHVNALMKIVGTLRDIKQALNELEEAGLIRSQYRGNLRQLFPNLSQPLSIAAFELVEEQEKQNASAKFPEIKKIENRVDPIKKIFGKELVSIALFGSVARGHITKESDIDILIIVKKEEAGKKDKLAKLLQTTGQNIGREIMPAIIEEKEFKKQLSQNASFAKQAQKERIILCGTRQFLSLANKTPEMAGKLHARGQEDGATETIS